ncbi:MAG: ABC transporter permease [Planctomycetota bacterium]
MARWRNLLGWAADGLLAAPGRGVLAVLTIAFSLFWLISGLALSEGLRAQARAALRGGADLFIGADAFGLDAPIGIDRAQQLAALPGVEAVVPRILGRARVADRWVVIAALDPIAANMLPPERQPALPASGMVALGAELAAALHARVGTRLVLEVVQARVFEVARVFDAAAGLGSANTVLMAFDDA